MGSLGFYQTIVFKSPDSNLGRGPTFSVERPLTIDFIILKRSSNPAC